MRNNENIVTSVSAQGSAVADFDIARFSVTATADGKTGVKAKETLRAVALQLSDLYTVYKKEGLAENLRTNVSVQPRYDWKRNPQPTLVGYTAKYDMVFHTTNLDKVSAIHDALTNIEGVQAEAPTFDIKDKSALSKEAFEAAFDKCQDRFKSECAVLGKDVSRFEVGSWDVYYSEDRQDVGVRTLSAMNNTMPEMDEAITIHSGKADVSCQLTVNFVHRR